MRINTYLAPFSHKFASAIVSCLSPPYVSVLGVLSLQVSQACDTLGKELALRGIELVYGGGNIGIMGAVASAVHSHGGKVIGVIPRVRTILCVFIY